MTLTSGVDPREVADDFRRRITRSSLSQATVDTYSQYVGQFCAWLAEQGPQYADALRDEWARDYAVKDWRRSLVDKGRSAATVDLAVTAVSQLYQHLGLGAPKIRRTSAPLRTAPKALSVDQQRWVLRAAERRGARELALVQMGMGAGLRVGEIVGLDLFDLRILERKGTVDVRLGKGMRRRQVPLHKQAREAVAAWLLERSTWGADSDAVFLARGRGGKGPQRISVRTVEHVVAQVGRDAGLDGALSPHVLRHTCARTLLESGAADIVTVQRVLGHERITTTSVYTQPTDAFIASAVEAITVDY